MRATARALGLYVSLMTLAGAAAASSDLWFHVRVDEGDGRAKVTVNLPLSMMERALPMIPARHLDHMHFDHGDFEWEVADLRELWQEVKNSPDMAFVTVEEGDESVRVWKEGSYLFVRVRDHDGDEQVDVRMPMALVDALLAHEDGEPIDLDRMMTALVDHGEGEFVSVRDGEESVRVWVDRNAEAE